MSSSSVIAGCINRANELSRFVPYGVGTFSTDLHRYPMHYILAMHPVLATACALQVGAQKVELHVLRYDPAWRWEVRFAGGQTLDVGEAASKFSAQVAAQHAFEHRMKRAGLSRRGITRYRWE